MYGVKRHENKSKFASVRLNPTKKQDRKVYGGKARKLDVQDDSFENNPLSEGVSNDSPQESSRGVSNFMENVLTLEHRPLRRSERLSKRLSTSPATNFQEIQSKYRETSPLTNEDFNGVFLRFKTNVDQRFHNELREELERCTMSKLALLDVESRSAPKRKEQPVAAAPVVEGIPRAKWVYRTPEKQRIKQVVLKESGSSLQPVIIRTTDNGTALYDFDQNMVPGRDPREVTFDAGSMKPFATFERNEFMDMFDRNASPSDDNDQAPYPMKASFGGIFENPFAKRKLFGNSCDEPNADFSFCPPNNVNHGIHLFE